jgi:hypothetical protein
MHRVASCCNAGLSENATLRLLPSSFAFAKWSNTGLVAIIIDFNERCVSNTLTLRLEKLT